MGTEIGKVEEPAGSGQQASEARYTPLAGENVAFSSQVRDCLRKVLDSKAFDAWGKGIRVLAEDEKSDSWRIPVANRYTIEIVEPILKTHLKDASNKILGRTVEIQFVVDGSIDNSEQSELQNASSQSFVGMISTQPAQTGLTVQDIACERLTEEELAVLWDIAYEKTPVDQQTFFKMARKILRREKLDSAFEYFKSKLISSSKEWRALLPREWKTREIAPAVNSAQQGTLFPSEGRASVRLPAGPPPKVKVHPSLEGELKEIMTLLSPGEVRLETIGYFIPTQERPKVTSRERRLSIRVKDGRKQASIRISANVDYGLPNTADLDFYRAFQVILWEEWRRLRRVPEWVSFTTSRLLTLAGRYRGDDWKAVVPWKRRLQSTLITFEAEEDVMEVLGYKKDRAWQVFSETSGDELIDLSSASPRRGVHTVQLSHWYRSNLENFFVKPIDAAGDLKLRSPVAKGLSSMLDLMFYAARGRSINGVITVSKKYEDVCNELMLSQFKSVSRIQQQFERPCRELQAIGKTSSFRPRLAKDGTTVLLEWQSGPRVDLIWTLWKDQISLPGSAPWEKALVVSPENNSADEGIRSQVVAFLSVLLKKLNLPAPAVTGQFDRAQDLVSDAGGFSEAASILEDWMRTNEETPAEGLSMRIEEIFEHLSKYMKNARTSQGGQA